MSGTAQEVRCPYNLNKVVGIGTCSGVDTDKFVRFRLTPLPAKEVGAPLIAECLANIECRVDRILDLGRGGRTKLVIGDVVAIHVEERVLDGTRVDHDVLKAVGRMAGNSYSLTRERFEVARPV